MRAFEIWPSEWLVPAIRFLLHFQLRCSEVNFVLSSLRRRVAPKFLVFGMGCDSAFWHAANRQGRTSFLEDNREWFVRMRQRTPRLDAHLVAYTTCRCQCNDLLSSESHARCEVALPRSIAAIRWDVILVDGPSGNTDTDPGRMQSIFMAAKLVADDGEVFVHDIDRMVERVCAHRFLAPTRICSTVGRLRRYYCDTH